MPILREPHLLCSAIHANEYILCIFLAEERSGYNCLECGTNLIEERSLRIHLSRSSHRASANPRTHTCGRCSQTFDKIKSVNSVKRVLRQIAPCNGTFGHIQETSHTSASTVERVFVIMAIYNSTFRHIQETSHTSVNSVKRDLFR